MKFLKLAFLCAAVGCGGGDMWTASLPDTVDASGHITHNGQPLEGATITFVPVGEGHAATAFSDSSGYFELKAFPSKEGAVAGQYQVGVMKNIQVDQEGREFDPGEDSEHHSSDAMAVGYESAIPEKFLDPRQSGIIMGIPPEGSTEMKIDLKDE